MKGKRRHKGKKPIPEEIWRWYGVYSIDHSTVMFHDAHQAHKPRLDSSFFSKQTRSFSFYHLPMFVRLENCQTLIGYGASRRLCGTTFITTFIILCSHLQLLRGYSRIIKHLSITESFLVW